MKRCWCWIVGHRPVRVIDAFEPRFGGVGGVHFQITAEHRECGRCGVTLDTGAPQAPAKG